MRKIITLLLLSGLIALALFYYQQMNDKTYRVIVLHSYNNNYSWKEELNKGVIDCFKKQRMNADIVYHYMDSEMLLERTETIYITSVLEKEVKNPPDLILVCDDQATYALLNSSHPLAYQTPIVFCGVDYPNENALKKHTNVTGFTTEPNFAKCIELIKHVYPETKVFTLNIIENFLGKRAKAVFQQQTDTLSEKTMVRSIEVNNSYVIGWGALHTPGEGTILPVWDSFYSGLINDYDFPCYLANNEGLGNGYLGGYMTPFYTQTYLATERGIQILNGADIKSLPITPSPQTMIFDWTVMQRFNISPKQLPAGSTIIKMPFYEKHKRIIYFSGIFILLIIIGLGMQLTRLYKKERRNKKQALYRLQDHKNKLDITMKSLREGVISIDKEFRIFTINKAALQCLGLQPDASLYIGKNVFSLLNVVQNENENYLKELLSSLYTNFQEASFESDCQIQVTENQHIFSINGELSGIYQEGELYGAVIVFHDITQELIQKESLSLTLSAGNVFCWQFNRQTRMFTFDKSFFEQSAIQASDTRQISFQDIESLIFPEDLEVLRNTITDSQTGKKKRITHQIRANLFGKGYTWWEYRLAIVQDYNVNCGNQIYGLLFNIQSYKDIEEELIRAYTKAEQSEKLKSAFLANMSHEIRTPLNGIVGFANLLTSGDEFEPEEIQLFLDSIRKNCSLLLALISDILDLAQIDSNNMSFRIVPCDINELINQIVITQRVIIPGHLQLICHIPEKTVYLETDPLRLNQILTNLINNAIKFTEQGSITIGYTADELGYLNFFVQDTGKGIPKDDLNNIFLRFFKKDDFTQGAGLGLSICKVIVNRFNGTIHVDSEPGQGTRFTIRIPYKPMGTELRIIQ